MNKSQLNAILGHSPINIAERYAAVKSRHPLETAARERLVTPQIDAEIRARAEWVAGYRAYLAATVHQASPVLLDLCRHEQLDLDAIAWRMPAVGPRPGWLRNGDWLSGLHHAREQDAWRTGGIARLVRGNLARFVQAPLVVRERGHLEGALALRALNGCMEVIAELGTAILRTRAGHAELTIGTPIPETLRQALRGMPLDAVIDHPSLACRGYLAAAMWSTARTGVRPDGR